MGQYYNAVVIDSLGNVVKFSPRDYENFYKLMEHSWVGNKFVNVVYRAIHNHPQRVAWIGDYSNDYYEDEYHCAYQDKIAQDDFMKYFDICWRETPVQPKKIRFSVMPVTESTQNRYLLNHTTKQYIDLYKHAIQYEGEWGAIDPLPLLTACGNGRGGGDYHGTHMELVGAWAFDVLELVCKKSKIAGYQELTVSFTED